MRVYPQTFCVVTLLFAMVPWTTVAQDRENGAKKSTLDGVYTEQQARRGAQLYENICAECHDLDEFMEPLMQSWMGAVDFQIVVQGKPYGAWEPFVPITFEMGVLFAAFTSLFGMLALNGLPRFNHPLFRSERFLSVSDDRYMIAVEADDPKFDPEQTRAFLESLGGTDIELIEDD